MYLTFDQWAQRVTYDGLLVPALIGSDYEWRFTGSSLAWKQYEDSALVSVPFELWDIGKTPDDARDDVRLIPVLCEHLCAEGGMPGVFDLVADSPLSRGNDDPFTDGVYWFRPADTSPGEAGYQAYVQAATAPVRSFAAVGEQVWARLSVVGLNFGATPPYPMALPEVGTVFRIVTATPQVDAPVPTGPADGSTVRPGDVFSWMTPDGVPRLQIQVAATPDFDPTVLDEHLSLNGGYVRGHYIPASEPGVYYWRVRSRGIIDSPWSAVRSYRVGAPTGTEATQTTLPQSVSVVAFPNPFVGRATFRVGLDAPQRVRLALYDMMGRQVAVLADEPKAAGWHDLVFDASPLASGVYLYRLVAGSTVHTGTVVRVR